MKKNTLLWIFALLLSSVIACSSSEPKEEAKVEPAPETKTRAMESIEVTEPEKPETAEKKFGCVEGDCTNGIGKYIYENGDIYTGSFKDDKRNGKGSFLYTDGETFTGDYVEDRREGLGEYKFKNGDSYKGEFKAGQINGKGLYTFQDGKVLDGKFQEGAEGEGNLLDQGKTRPCKIAARKLICE